jgi:uncharacterized protein (TIGR00255 family)
MTGFGRSTAAEHNYAITVELKTVNNRFLDVNLKLGSELQTLEAVLKRMVGSRLSRGRVDVYVQYEKNDEVTYELNRPMIEGFLTAMRSMKDEFALAGDPDINVIARLPNVLVPNKTELEPEFFAAVESTFTAALDDLEKMREKEGGLLATELVERLALIESRLPVIENESAKVADEFLERLTKRINDMLSRSGSQIDIDQGRLTQEVAYLADKADISEEITRLRTHIEHFRSIMKEEKDVGKRLDFLTQELNREANTITSKTNNMIVKENALAIKSEIEKIREQVQNVE